MGRRGRPAAGRAGTHIGWCGLRWRKRRRRKDWRGPLMMKARRLRCWWIFLAVAPNPREEAADRGHYYSAVQLNMIKGCVNLNYAHATFGHVYLDCIVHFSPLLLRPGHHLLSLWLTFFHITEWEWECDCARSRSVTHSMIDPIRDPMTMTWRNNPFCHEVQTVCREILTVCQTLSNHREMKVCSSLNATHCPINTLPASHSHTLRSRRSPCHSIAKCQNEQGI